MSDLFRRKRSPGEPEPQVEVVPRVQLDVSKFRGPFFGGDSGEEGSTIKCHGFRPSH